MGTGSAPLTLGTKPTAREWWLSAFEVALGAFIVIGHNVFHILPNEVPLLFILFWLSVRIHTGQWMPTILKRPESWLRTVLIALAASAILVLGSQFLVQPIAGHIWHHPERAPSILHNVAAFDWKRALSNLALVWVFAGFGEEVGYRGYLLSRAADLGHRSRLAYVIAMLYTALLFGFGHFFKGPAGIMDSTWSGVVLGSAYLVSGRNLWASILAHGIVDTLVVFLVFMGWNS